jgi:hypothetical protein
VCGQSGFWEHHCNYSLLQIVFVFVFFLVAADIVFFFFVLGIIVFFLVDVRGTALRTPSYIDCGPRL